MGTDVQQRPRTGGRGAHVRSSATRYIASIDGLRAFAVLSVIAYHMHLGWAPGGLMGVTVFFVISGYLINGLLVAEYERNGRIDLPGFWLRRVRRLFPAVALSVVGIWAACALLSPLLLSRMLPDIPSALLFYNNWWQIFHDVSYFEAWQASSPLKHFWSLAIEEQFYLIWPPVLALLFKKGAKKSALAVLVAVLAVASAVEMGLLYEPAGDPSRVYYGTDTRAMSLLAGVFLTFVWPSSAFSERSGETGRARVVVMSIVGLAALVGLVLTVRFTTGFSDFPYRGGIALTTVLSALLVASLVVPGTVVDRLLSFAPFVWIGKISYGMYLWHYPIILLTTNPNAAAVTPWYVHALQLALTIGISAASYYLVENPVRRGAIGKWVRDLRAHKPRVGKRTAKVVVSGICFAALLAVAIHGTLNMPEQAREGLQAGQLTPEQLAELAERKEGSAEPSEDAPTDEPEPSGFDTLSDLGSFVVPDDLHGEQRFNGEGLPIYDPLLIGDSVSLGAEAAFYDVFPNGHLDSVVSRNIWESPYDDYADADQVGDIVVFCLGTNNAVEDWQIDEDLLSHVPGSKLVVMVNTRSYTDWVDYTNDAIAYTPERYPNVKVVDWYSASEGHDEYFAGDGTHLTSDGAAAYVELIRVAIEGE